MLHCRLEHLIQTMGIGLVLDVGAYQGTFVLRLRKAGYRGQIVSFEPNVELHASLHALAAKDRSWQVEHFGVGELPGEGTFYVTQDRGFTSLSKPNEFARIQFGSLTTVHRSIVAPIRRLDDVLRERFREAEVPRFCLKTDTQGHDLDVYRSLGELAGRCRIVLTEMPFRKVYEGVPSFEEMMSFFKDRGFSPVDVFPVSRANDQSLIEADVLLIRSPQAN